ncbi:MAG: PAS domain-containing protein, partial [Anaerolineales bacterium]
IALNFRDISEQRAADEQLHFQAALLDRIGQAVIATDLAGRITFWNQRAEVMYGWRRAEVIGRSVVEVTPSQMSREQGEAIMRLLGAGQSWEGEFTVQRRDGTTFPAQVNDSPVLDEQGALVGIIGISADISVRKQAEAAIARTNDLLKQAEQLGHVGSWETDAVSGQEVWSEGIFRILGLEPGAYPAALANYLEHVHPDDRERVLRADHAGGQAKAPLELEYRIVRPDGAVRDIYSRSETRHGEGGQQRRVGINMDITERKQAEAAMARTNDLLSRAEQLGHLGSWWRDLTTLQVIWSEGLYRILGLEPGQVEPSFAAFMERVHPDDQQAVKELVENVVRGGPVAEVPVESRLIRADGQVRRLSTRAQVTRDGQGKALQLVGLTLDVTELWQHERELEAIAIVSAALRTANTPAQMQPIILEHVTSLLEANAASVTLRDPASDETVVEAGWGPLRAVVGKRLPAGEGIAGRVIASGQPYSTASTHTDPAFHAWAEVEQAAAAVCVPLITHAFTLGALWVGREAAFSDGDTRVLTAIADIAASAIQRARLHEQTEKRLRQLAAMREIDDAIMGSMDLGITLSVILPHTMAQLGVAAADVLLLNRVEGVLEYAAGTGFRTKGIQKSRLRLGEAYPGLAALNRELLSVPDLQAGDPRYRRAALLAGEGFVSYFCAPLLAKGQVVGVLEVFHRAPLNPDADWLGFLQTLAAQTAIAVADARLFADLQRSNLDITLAYDTTLEGWSAALDLRDKETEGHSQRV